ncbi:MAG: glycosyltransferase family 39 protein, partial [Chroococcidiopsidaceae cyanobacterium CP_BM_RX_35]|nr:glycosyltransferase family 39 protein [Chroococcidiopsidaceae cyanobacterium CP_BM_RX_35]
MNLSFNRAFSYWLKSKRNRPVLTWTLSILWLLLLSYLAFFWNLGSTGLVDETEPLFAEAARQMTVTGDWITPFFDGKTRFDKPILIYWLMAIAYEVLGVNSWAVRLPSALSAMGLVSLGFYTLRSFGGGNPAQFPSRPSSGNLVPRYWISAGLGSALMALHPQTIVWARTGVSDMLLTACMGGALLSFFLGYAQPTKPMVQMRWYLAFYVLVALAVLTKGPVGIVLPGLIISSFLLYTGNIYPVWQEMRPLRGTLLMILIAVPWYVLVIQANGWDYVDAFFGHHNFARFTTVLEHNSEPWYFYLLVVLLGFAPWSVYLPVALARLKFWRRNIWRSTQRSNHLGLFALFWFVSVLGFFTLARTKLPSYMLPLMPAAAILVTLMWSEQLTQGNAGAFSGTADKGEAFSVAPGGDLR